MSKNTVKTADNSRVFFNRELSWIEFNARVLAEACNQDVPLFERIKFLSIVSSNFDEFFMVRVAGLKHQARQDPERTDISGLTAKQQTDKIAKRAKELFSSQHRLFKNEILPLLKQEGISYVSPEEFTTTEKQYTKNLFIEQIFPLLTPLRTGINGELPHIANLRIHVAFLLKPLIDENDMHNLFKPNEGEDLLALVQIPPVLERIVWLPTQTKEKRFTLLDDIIMLFGTHLFSGYSVEQTLVFKAVCDAAFSVDEEQDEKFIEAMEEVLLARQKSVPIRLTCTSSGNDIAKILIQKTGLMEQDVYSTDTRFIDLKTLNIVEKIEGFSHLRYPAWRNFYPSAPEKNEPMWDILKQKDILLHVPYESYEPVLQFVNDAAEDPDVLAIKMTLYRTSRNSPLVKSLEKAARKGKQVTVFVELKARFDEKRNISWANQLQQAGVIVVYGIAHLKVHAKILLVVRREHSGIVRYVHMGTGNYNEKTARLYTDMSIFTANTEIANDASFLFNMISGYSVVQAMNCLFMAPINLKTQLLTMIEREIQCSTQHTPGLIMAKMNSLSHPEIIRALYRASCTNVRILLNVRGICMLVPGVSEQSENIQVVSIIDRFLEHSRIFYFQNGGAEELYLSSADWMPRNLDRRVELMFPVQQKNIFKQIKNILSVYFADNQKSYKLMSDGTWVAKKSENEKPLRSQEYFYAMYRRGAEAEHKKNSQEFVVRKKSQKTSGKST